MKKNGAYFSSQENNKKFKFSNNRLYFLLAIIFLFFFAVIIRLYNLQIIDHQEYLKKAKQQHSFSSELKAERGRIYLRNQRQELYPIALNRNFATLYVNPKALREEQRDKILESIFIVFHRDEVEAEVDRLLKKEEEETLKNELNYIDSLFLAEEEKEEKRREALSRQVALKDNPEWAESRAERRALEIEERRQNIINEYFIKIDAPNKHSRLLKRKIEREDLLRFYFEQLRETFPLLDGPEDLFIKNGQIICSAEKCLEEDFNPNNPKEDCQEEPCEDNLGRDITNLIWGFYYEWESLRYYPEKGLFSGVLGFSNLENVGNYGIEGFFNKELRGKDGKLLADRGSYRGEKIIINKQEYEAPVNGESLVLTIDYAVQLYVCQKLKEAQGRHRFDSASAVVMDPKTGRIIALCLWPDYDSNNYSEIKDIAFFDNQVVSYQYEPGSVFKAITMAIALDQGKITPETTYEDQGQINIKGWSKPIKNSDYEIRGGHGRVDMNYVLENSLNTGAIFAANQVGAEVFRDYLKEFGLGQKTGIELSAESSGNINNLLVEKVKEIDLATASFGQGIAVTPLQMISAFSVLANQGVLMKPYLVEEILDDKGELLEEIKPQELRRVISEETAAIISAMLVNVVEHGHARRSQIPGYYVGGKTGTAQIPSPRGGYLSGQYIHNFLGYAPISDPRFVLLVKFDNPKTSLYAEGTVVPVFAEITDFLLKYYQVPQER